MSREIWLPIKGYVGLYEVSSFGRVRSLNYNHTGHTKVLSPVEDGGGYLQVGLCKNGKCKKFKIHRLVAQAFLPNWFDDREINHIDENPKNNHIDNLEWCDSKYNTNYGTRNEHIAEKLSKPVIQLTKTGELVREWPSTIEAGRNGFKQGAVSLCCRGKLNYHKGFIWRYKESA